MASFSTETTGNRTGYTNSTGTSKTAANSGGTSMKVGDVGLFLVAGGVVFGMGFL